MKPDCSEHLFILRKPFPQENLSRIRYSTWSGLDHVQ